ncbi:hypothetical protein ACFW04_006572 [Cataglyphis niger]
MREDEFYMILPSNSSMRYFPENKTTCFTTELPQRVDLHGRWEVALTEIQFPCSFLHIRPGKGLMRFIDITERDKIINAMKAQVPSGIYTSVRDIEAVNYTAKSVASHIVWQFEVVIGGKIVIKVSCEEEKCDITHYVNFSDKLQRILGFDTPDEPASLLRGIPDKLFVYCDICEPYITGDVQSPLLRIVTHDARNDYAFASTQIKHFSSAQYIALRQTCFCTIEIDIRDQLGQSIPFEFGTLTVTLHFRRID